MRFFGLTRYVPEEMIAKIVVANAPNEEILKWCKEQNITATFIGEYNMDKLWIIENDSDRVFFSLRWAE